MCLVRRTLQSPIHCTVVKGPRRPRLRRRESEGLRNCTGSEFQWVEGRNHPRHYSIECPTPRQQSSDPTVRPQLHPTPRPRSDPGTRRSLTDFLCYKLQKRVCKCKDMPPTKVGNFLLQKSSGGHFRFRNLCVS